MAGKRKQKESKEKQTKDSAKNVPERSIPPTSTTDPKDKTERRKSKDVISTFQGHLDQKEGEHVKEQRRTLEKIRILRKDNERLQRKQEMEYGMTLDALEELNVTIDKTRTANQKLFEEMEESKTLHDKLEAELKATKQKYLEMDALCAEMRKQTKVWNETKVRFVKSEERVSDLRQANKRLRFILLNNHIDHTADARTLTTKPVEDNLSLKTHHTFPTMSKRHLTVKSRYALAKDIEQIRQMNAADLKRQYGIKPVNLDQVSPAYLGFYLKRKRRSVLQLELMQNPPKDIQYTYYRSGLTLPRVNARQYDRLTLE